MFLPCPIPSCNLDKLCLRNQRLDIAFTDDKSLAKHAQYTTRGGRRRDRGHSIIWRRGQQAHFFIAGS
ncbi:hypothetical protein AB1N83_010656 [Pleurotus pulmonarius]